MKVKRRKNSVIIGRTSFVLLTLIALTISLAFTFFEYERARQSEFETVKRGLTEVEGIFKNQLIDVLQRNDTKQLEWLLLNITNKRDITAVEIHDNTGFEISSGYKVKSEFLQVSKFELNVNNLELSQTKRYFVSVYGSTLYVERNLTDRVLILSFIEIVKVFVLGIFMLFAFKILFVRHLDRIIEFISELSLYNSSGELELNRRFSKFRKSQDSLDILVEAFNTLKFQVRFELVKNQEIQHKLSLMNTELENRVKEKTKELLMSSRIAAVGEMSAGVAHEVNSPLSTIFAINERIKRIIGKDEVDIVQIEALTSKLKSTLNKVFHITNSLALIAPKNTPDVSQSVLLKIFVEECTERLIDIFKHSHKSIEYELIGPEDGKFLIDLELTFQILFHTMNYRVKMYQEGNKNWVKLIFEIENDTLKVTYLDNARPFFQTEIDHLSNPFLSTGEQADGTQLITGTISALLDRIGGVMSFETNREFEIIRYDIISKEVL
jgi:C4-dicarboxylate-specific signal transduction histidine kinase